MTRLKTMTLGFVTAASLVLGVGGIAQAAASSVTKTNNNIGSSGISRNTFQQDRLDVEAQILNTTTSNVQAAHKNKTFQQLLSNAGLTKQAFHQKVKAELTTKLASQGYTQDQITIALQHHDIARLRHHKK